MSELPANCSLNQAREWLRARVTEGAPCPCCTQFAKVYRRKINSSMACVLIMISRFFKNNQEPWLHVPSHIESQPLSPKMRAAVRGDWAKLIYWNCLEAKPGEREDGSSRIGFWRTTKTGEDFVSGLISLPRYARIYDNRCLNLEGEPISVSEALGSRFNYSELMSNE